MNYLEFILTILTIVTALLAIATFVSGKKKDGQTSGEQLGSMSQKLDDISKSLEDIQEDVREVRKSEGQTGRELSAVRESARSAHKRIDTLEKRLQKLIDGKTTV